MAIIAIFVGAMLALGILAVVFIVFNQPAPPTPRASRARRARPSVAAAGVVRFAVAKRRPYRGPHGRATDAPPGATPTPFVPPTSTPVSNSPVVLSGTLWQSATLNYSFEYDPERWTLIDSTDDTAVFSSVNFDAQAIIHAVPATTSVAELIAQRLSWSTPS